MPNPRRGPIAAPLCEDDAIVVPAHPGRYVDYHLLEMRVLTATGIKLVDVAEAAERAGMTVGTLNNIRAGRVALTAASCLALERLTGVRAETWAETQWTWDLYQERSQAR